MLAKKPWIVPIRGTTKVDRLKENIQALDIHLTPKDLDAIEKTSCNIHIQGKRYPDALEQMTGR